MLRITIGTTGDKKYETVIEDNVAKPVKEKAKKQTAGRVYAYPFLSMKPGQSFVVPDKDAAEKAKRGGYQKPYHAHVTIAEIKDGEHSGKWRVWYDGPRVTVTEAEVDAAVAAAKPALDARAHEVATELARLAVANG